jgi:hypothetical protein
MSLLPFLENKGLLKYIIINPVLQQRELSVSYRKLAGMSEDRRRLLGSWFTYEKAKKLYKTFSKVDH